MGLTPYLKSPFQSTCQLIFVKFWMSPDTFLIIYALICMFAKDNNAKNKFCLSVFSLEGEGGSFFIFKNLVILLLILKHRCIIICIIINYIIHLIKIYRLY